LLIEGELNREMFPKIKNIFLHKIWELFNNEMFTPFVEEQAHPITGPSLTLEINGQVFCTFSLKQLLSNSAMFLLSDSYICGSYFQWIVKAQPIWCHCVHRLSITLW
jgi:hypothetical protein